ncbi:hypothetical protein F5B17DRAFT_384190 [Nemania serpens]|nr:hypothetical protein F5B17DRAFT_384190 [Nemania serpens]
MVSQLHVLRSNATLIPPTPSEPFYKVSVTNPKTDCTICIAATKPFPDPILIHPLLPNYRKLKPKPAEWVSIMHAGLGCGCVDYAFEEEDLFDTWRHIHLQLRHQDGDDASRAFYPEFEYEVGEALAHASLVASLAVGRPVPESYDGLVDRFGALALINELRDRDRELDRDKYSEEEAEGLDDDNGFGSEPSMGL